MLFHFLFLTCESDDMIFKIRTYFNNSKLGAPTLMMPGDWGIIVANHCIAFKIPFPILRRFKLITSYDKDSENVIYLDYGLGVC